MRQEATSPVSFRVNVARLSKNGVLVTVEADDEQRTALAVTHGLLSVETYRAELSVRAWKRNGVSVEGKVTADITQECVVTLDPLPARIDADVSAVFLPEDSKLGREGFGSGGEILIDTKGDDAPETFSGDFIDVGALAEEFFGLAIDPYPRRSDAELPSVDAETREVDGPLQRKLRLITGKN